MTTTQLPVGPTEIRPAQFPEHLNLVRDMLLEYQASLGISLCFQNFEAELAGLPGAYSAPKGRLLLAWANGQALGCVGLRALAADLCEMKRLYLRPAARGQQLGRRLAQAICAQAKEIGYQAIRLDTLPSMGAAQALYASMGFVQVPAYVANPIQGTHFLELDLTTWQPATTSMPQESAP
jgi:ribosomal protein S18 acetylase RimI-like enzyme